MLNDIEAKQRCNVEDDNYGDGQQDELGVFQEWQTGVAVEGDEEVVAGGKGVQGVADKQRQPVILSEHWKKHKLQHVQQQPDNEESIAMDVKTVCVLKSSLGELVTFLRQEFAYSEIEDGGNDESQEQEINQDHVEHESNDSDDSRLVGESPTKCTDQ